MKINSYEIFLDGVKEKEVIVPSKMTDFIDLLYFKTTMAVRPVFHMPSIKWLLASVTRAADNFGPASDAGHFISQRSLSLLQIFSIFIQTLFQIQIQSAKLVHKLMRALEAMRPVSRTPLKSKATKEGYSCCGAFCLNQRCRAF